MAISKISFLVFFSKILEIAAAPATQQADEDPRPTPKGMSD